MSELVFASEEEAIQHLADITGKSIKIAEDIKKQKLKSAVKKKINKKLQEINSPPYYDEIPLDNIFNILEENGVVPLQEDNTKWAGILVGAEGNTKMNLASKDVVSEVVGNENLYIPYANTMLILTWYKVDNGKYEICNYVS